MVMQTLLYLISNGGVSKNTEKCDTNVTQQSAGLQIFFFKSVFSLLLYGLMAYFRIQDLFTFQITNVH